MCYDACMTKKSLSWNGQPPGARVINTSSFGFTAVAGKHAHLIGYQYYIILRCFTTSAYIYQQNRSSVYKISLHVKDYFLGGGFNYFLFSSLFRGRFPCWRAYFSNGLVQPPTRRLFSLTSTHIFQKSKSATWLFRVFFQPASAQAAKRKLPCK